MLPLWFQGAALLAVPVHILMGVALVTAPLAGAYMGRAAQVSGLNWPRYALTGGFLWACLFLPGIHFGMRLRGASSPLYRLATVYALVYFLWLTVGIIKVWSLTIHFASLTVAPQWIAFYVYGLLAVSAAAWLGSLVWLLRGNNWFHDPDPLSSGATPRLSQLQPYILATLWILLTAIGEMVRWVSNTTLF